MKKTFAFDYSRAVVSAAKKLGVQTHVFARGPESEMYVRCSKDQCKSISAAAGSGPNWSSKKKIGALLEEGGEFSDDAAGLREYVAAVCLDEVALAMASPRARPRFSTPGKGCALINAIRGVLGLAPLEGDPSTSGPPLIYTGFPEKPGYNVEGGFRLFDKRLFGDGGRGGRDVEEMMNQNESEEKTCSACAYSFMEPDGPLLRAQGLRSVRPEPPPGSAATLRARPCQVRAASAPIPVRGTQAAPLTRSRIR